MSKRLVNSYECATFIKYKVNLSPRRIPGGGTFLKGANGDVPLDGVAFLRLV